MITPPSTHHITRRVLSPFALACALLFAAACGSADTADPAADAPEQPEAVAGSDSPIENLLGVPVFDQVALDAWFNNLSLEVEREIAICMRAQGFEYTPAGGTVVTVSDDAVAADSLEFAQSRGLDIVASFNEAEFDPGRHGNDANATLIASLSDSERDAYYMALLGTSEPLSDDGPPAEGNGGCTGTATDEVFSVLDVFEAIGPTFESYYDLYISDSRIIETTNEWQRCMNEAGHAFNDEDSLFEQFSRELNVITNAEDAFKEFDPETLGVTPDVQGGFDFHPGLNAGAQAKVDELGQREIKAAVANWTCTEPHREIQLEVQREYEDQFVAEVGPRVAAIRGE